MTPDDLQRLHEAATSAPWDYTPNIGAEMGYVAGSEDVVAGIINIPGAEKQNESNADLIVTARNVLPLLIDLWRAAEVVAQRAEDYESARDVDKPGDLTSLLSKIGHMGDYLAALAAHEENA